MPIKIMTKMQMLVVVESSGTIQYVLKRYKYNIVIAVIYSKRYLVICKARIISFFSMDDPPMKEYQDYAPQEQQKNGFSQPLQPAETIPMTQYQEQQPPAYQQQNSNPFKNQSQSNPFKK